MAKTDKTLDLERRLWFATNKTGVFGCFEVTIGFRGRERVDYLTYDTKGVWRCYEIKVSKEDFYSESKITFVGNYNYFVMPDELYEIVQADIPSHIGVHNGSFCIKRPKKQELQVDEEILKYSLIRSLSRENQKFILTGDQYYINNLKNRIRMLEKNNLRLSKEYNNCFANKTSL